MEQCVLSAFLRNTEGCLNNESAKSHNRSKYDALFKVIRAVNKVHLVNVFTRTTL